MLGYDPKTLRMKKNVISCSSLKPELFILSSAYICHVSIYHLSVIYDLYTCHLLSMYLSSMYVSSIFLYLAPAFSSPRYTSGNFKDNLSDKRQVIPSVAKLEASSTVGGRPGDPAA